MVFWLYGFGFDSTICRFPPNNKTRRFLLPISSRQIDESISIADFFPPNRKSRSRRTTPEANEGQTVKKFHGLSFDLPEYL